MGEAGDRVDERRLASSVGPDQSDQLADLHVEVDVRVGVQAAVGDREAAGLEEGHQTAVSHVRAEVG